VGANETGASEKSTRSGMRRWLSISEPRKGSIKGFAQSSPASRHLAANDRSSHCSERTARGNGVCTRPSPLRGERLRR
jgi:hypothetical protein